MSYAGSRQKSVKSIDESITTLLEVLQELVTELHPTQSSGLSITIDSSLDRDLGLDSLSRVELLSRVEKTFDLILAERIFFDAETPRDLLRAILSASTSRATVRKHDISSLQLAKAEVTPQTAETLVEILHWHVKKHPDRPHIQFYRDDGEGELITYGELLQGAQTIAAGLQQQGIAFGEPVGIILPTERDYFFTFFGILLAGGVPVPLYPPLRMAMLEDHLRRQCSILNNCGASLLITMPEAKRFAQLLKSQLENLKSLLTVKELVEQSGNYFPPALGSQDLAFLQYTSGSTGYPKGVTLSHANLLANIRAMGKALHLNSTDVMVSWLPLYHDMGLIGAWLGAMVHGFLLVIMSPLDFIGRPQRWLWAIHRYRATISVAPNFAYELCLARIKEDDLQGLDLSCWRAALNGAEPVSVETMRRFQARFAPFGFDEKSLMPVYGLAESSVGLAFPPPGRGLLVDQIQRDAFMRSGQAIPTEEKEENPLQIVACGQPLPGHEIRIVDSTGRELPERQEGRLQFRGPSSTSGYFRNPEQTQQLFREDWLDSGDHAYIVAGEVYITGRFKDMIIRAGRNIYPQELEEAVSKIPHIRKGNVAVFGSKDPKSGTERLIVLAETRQTELSELSHLRRAINAIAVDILGASADEVLLVPPKTILKTSSGKIRRIANLELYEKGTLGKRHTVPFGHILRLIFQGGLVEWRRKRRVLAIGFYGAYFWSLVGFFIPLVWCAVALLPKASWRWSLIHRVAHLLVDLLRIRVSVQGIEELPLDQAYVIVSNHCSYLDPFILVACLPRNFRFVAKVELTKYFGVHYFLRRIGTEFVERFNKQKGIEDTHHLSHSMVSSHPILIFPEGTLTRMPGLLPFHLGAFQTAAEAGLPVIPIAIRGTRSILRDGSWLPRRGSISLNIGEKIPPEAVTLKTGMEPWKVALKLRDLARSYILHSCGEPDLAHETTRVLDLPHSH